MNEGWGPRMAEVFPDFGSTPLIQNPLSRVLWILNSCKVEENGIYIVFKINGQCFNFGLCQIYPNGCKLDLN